MAKIYRKSAKDFYVRKKLNNQIIHNVACSKMHKAWLHSVGGIDGLFIPLYRTNIILEQNPRTYTSIMIPFVLKYKQRYIPVEILDTKKGVHY